MQVFKWGGAAVFALFAFLMWWGFLREVPTIEATGTVQAKLFSEGGVYKRVPARATQAGTEVKMSDAYAFDVRIEESGDVVRAKLNELAARDFEQGDHVRVAFQRRGFPPLWERVTVLRMEAATP